MSGHHSAFLDVRETAWHLRLTPGYVRKLIANGQLPAVRRGSGPNAGLLVPRVVLETWLTPSTGGAWSGDGRALGMEASGLEPSPDPTRAVDTLTRRQPA